MTAHHLISVDWGTSSLRASLIKANPFQLIDRVEDHQLGIHAVHQSLPQTGAAERIAFYQVKLNEVISRLGSTDSGWPVLISGMASSSIGMLELPYRPLPIALRGVPLDPHHLPPTKAFPFHCYLFTGLCDGERDVMRGEETQVLGLMDVPDQALILVPGTHCKHVTILGGAIVNFTTFMTGELFSLLARHSILRNSVVPSNASASLHPESFRDGVLEGAAQPLSAALFGVRTADLFARRSRQANADFLSGLLIGSELASIQTKQIVEVILCGGKLTNSYRVALETLGIGDSLRVIPKHDSELAAARMHTAWWKAFPQ